MNDDFLHKMKPEGSEIPDVDMAWLQMKMLLDKEMPVTAPILPTPPTKSIYFKNLLVAAVLGTAFFGVYLWKSNNHHIAVNNKGTIHSQNRLNPPFDTLAYTSKSIGPITNTAATKNNATDSGNNKTEPLIVPKKAVGTDSIAVDVRSKPENLSKLENTSKQENLSKQENNSKQENLSKQENKSKQENNSKPENLSKQESLSKQQNLSKQENANGILPITNSHVANKKMVSKLFKYNADDTNQKADHQNITTPFTAANKKKAFHLSNGNIAVSKDMEGRGGQQAIKETAAAHTNAYHFNTAVPNGKNKNVQPKLNYPNTDNASLGNQEDQKAMDERTARSAEKKQAIGKIDNINRDEKGKKAMTDEADKGQLQINLVDNNERTKPQMVESLTKFIDNNGNHTITTNGLKKESLLSTKNSKPFKNKSIKTSKDNNAVNWDFSVGTQQHFATGGQSNDSYGSNVSSSVWQNYLPSFGVEITKAKFSLGLVASFLQPAYLSHQQIKGLDSTSNPTLAQLFQLPVHLQLGYTVFNDLKIFTGVGMSFNQNAILLGAPDSSGRSITQVVNSKDFSPYGLQQTNAFWLVGAEYNIGRFIIGAQYSKGFNPLVDYKSISQSQHDFQLFCRYMLFRKKKH